MTTPSPKPMTPMTRLSSPETSHVPFSRPTTPGLHGYKIGWVGLGAMGYLMARNLANYRSQHYHGGAPVRVWNRTFSKSEQLVNEAGANKVIAAQSLAEIAIECDVIFTNLANDQVVKDVYLQFVDALKVRNHKNLSFS